MTTCVGMLNAAPIVTQATNTVITHWIRDLACLSQMNSGLQQIHWAVQCYIFLKINGKA